MCGLSLSQFLANLHHAIHLLQGLSPSSIPQKKSTRKKKQKNCTLKTKKIDESSSPCLHLPLSSLVFPARRAVRPRGVPHLPRPFHRLLPQQRRLRGARPQARRVQDGPTGQRPHSPDRALPHRPGPQPPRQHVGRHPAHHHRGQHPHHLQRRRQRHPDQEG